MNLCKSSDNLKFGMKSMSSVINKFLTKRFFKSSKNLRVVRFGVNCQGFQKMIEHLKHEIKNIVMEVMNQLSGDHHDDDGIPSLLMIHF